MEYLFKPRVTHEPTHETYEMSIATPKYSLARFCRKNIRGFLIQKFENPKIQKVLPHCTR